MDEPSGGLRYDEGKSRVDLLPADALLELGKVYLAGAIKYTKDTPLSPNSMIYWLYEELERCGVSVTGIERHTLSDAAEPVMRKSCGKITRNMQKGRGSTVSSGEKGSQREFVCMKKNGDQILPVLRVISERESFRIFEQRASLCKVLVHCGGSREISVLSALALYHCSPSILTMTTIQDSREVTFVAAATTDSDSSLSLLRYCAKLFNISAIQLQLVSRGGLCKRIVPGARNWEKGMPWSKVLGPLLRHLFKFMSGKRVDEESGLSHLTHVAWNALALLTYELRGIGINDVHEMGEIQK